MHDEREFCAARIAQYEFNEPCMKTEGKVEQINATI